MNEEDNKPPQSVTLNLEELTQYIIQGVVRDGRLDKQGARKNGVSVGWINKFYISRQQAFIESITISVTPEVDIKDETEHYFVSKDGTRERLM